MVDPEHRPDLPNVETIFEKVGEKQLEGGLHHLIAQLFYQDHIDKEALELHAKEIRLTEGSDYSDIFENIIESIEDGSVVKEIITEIAWDENILMNDWGEMGDSDVEWMRNFDILWVYSEELLDMADEIEEILEENLHRADHDVNSRVLENSIRNRLIAKIHSPGVRNGIAESLLDIISGYNTIYPYITEVVDDIDEFHSFISRLGTKFEAEVGDAYLLTKQGENYWKSVRTDIVDRDAIDNVSFQHRIKTNNVNGRGYKTVNIDSTPSATFTIINHLLTKQITISEEYPSTSETIPEHEIEAAENKLQEIKSNIDSGEKDG